MGGPSVLGYINSLIGLRSIFIVVFIIAMITLIQTIRGGGDDNDDDDNDDEPRRFETPARADLSSGFISGPIASEQSSGLKED